MRRSILLISIQSLRIIVVRRHASNLKENVSTCYVGIDIAKRTYAAAVADSAGPMIPCSTAADGFCKLFADLPSWETDNFIISMEFTAHYDWSIVKKRVRIIHTMLTKDVIFQLS